MIDPQTALTREQYAFFLHLKGAYGLARFTLQQAAEFFPVTSDRNWRASQALEVFSVLGLCLAHSIPNQERTDYINCYRLLQPSEAPRLRTMEMLVKTLTV